MKIENFSFKHKKKSFSCQIAWPESLPEAIATLEPSDIWEAFKIGYRELAKKRVINPTQRRRRFVKVDLEKLSPGDRDALLQFLSNAETFENQQPQQAQESVQPSEPPKDQTDFVETPEEAEASTSQRADSFEEDFSKYLAARSS